jgi:hypothetical protein
LFVQDFAMASGIEVFTPVSHTLFDPAEIISKVLVIEHSATQALGTSKVTRCLEFTAYLIFVLPTCRTVAGRL